jgi:type I restriction enzyme S subunit
MINKSTIPGHWEIKNLKSITESIQYGYTKSSSKEKNGPKFLRITDIQDNKVQWDDVPYCKIDDGIKGKYLLREGDLVFARTGATVGKSFLIKGKIPEAVFASYLIRVRVNQEINENYLYCFFNSPKYWGQITEGQVGIGQPNVNGTKLGQLEIPIPPIPEQLSITSKIEELFSELDKGKQQLETVKQQLKTYRQAVLKSAFDGKLTNKDIKASQLPEGWEWQTFQNVCNKIGDIDHKMPKSVPTGFPYVSTKDFTDDLKISFEKVKYIDKDDYLILSRKIKPEKEDIIFPRYGTIGKNIFVDFEKEFLVSYSCAVIKPNKEIIIPKYIYYYSLSPQIEDEIRSYIVETTQANIGIASIKRFIFPLPPLSEQKLIVQEIETRLSVCDKMEETIENSLRQVESLRQSILKQAFEGKLV